MVDNKLKSLQKALIYSYQSTTIRLKSDDGEYNREFRALINPDKVKNDYDNKILSIPYKAVQLNAPRVGKTTDGEIETGIQAGDVFYWKETDSYWLVYLQHKEERAYFRAEIRKCEKYVEVNGKRYWVWFRGPVETQITWRFKKQRTWNDMNYSAIIYIKQDENTLDFFHRFAIIKIDGNSWEVKAVDANCGDGIIEVQLGETFSNSIEEAHQEEQEQNKVIEEELPYYAAYIDGSTVVYPYDIKYYKVRNIEGGNWSIDDKVHVRIVDQNDKVVKLAMTTGKSGKFTLFYKTDKGDELELPITIASL